MRIVAESNEAVIKSSSTSIHVNTKHDVKPTDPSQSALPSRKENVIDEQEISKEKLQQAVNTINEFLQINHNASKFVFHDGLDRYFVQVVDTQTEEVVKEIPPKKLLDAFYEMQKLLGMIVDEKI